jgi:hypothetical protein
MRQAELLDEKNKSKEVKNKANIDGKDLYNKRNDHNFNDKLNELENSLKTKSCNIEKREQLILNASLLSNPLISTIKNNDTNIIENVILNSTNSNSKTTISTQLGLKNEFDLNADLIVDYSLDLVVSKNNDYDFNFDAALLSNFSYGNNVDYAG